MNHLLIEKAFQYEIKETRKTFSEKYTYDHKHGYWLNKETGIPLMKEEGAYKPQSKKADVETGEDRKGE